MSAVFSPKEEQIDVPREITIWFELASLPLLSLLQPQQHPNEEDEGRTNSKGTFRKIKNWLQDCDIQHDYCRSLPSNNGNLWMPSRLIFVGTSASPTLRLCEDVSKGSNFFQVKRELSISALPKTFRDSINVTRQLDILYLWIDSLCIVQDSVNDWEKESQLIYEVYSNASLNIAATFARDGRDGLFSERHRVAVQPCVVEVDWLPPDTASSSKDENSLNGEAGAGYLYQVVPNSSNWECAATSASELWPKFRRDTRWFTEIKMKMASRMQNYTLSSKNDFTETRRFEYFMAWADIVQQYTSCSLTYDSDKLPAIAGLAQHWQRLWGSEIEYFAGIWNLDLPYPLLWKPMAPSVREVRYTWTRPEIYIAPTWSWASVKGPISYVRTESSEQDEIMVLINDVRIIHVSNSRFGQIKESQISVSCRLAQVFITSKAGGMIKLGLDSDFPTLLDHSTV
ncbi:HET-domain-containing protein [Stipitochalara longipes BDJ]|nr:HET-domain-containing protein [Stipitochalara longipes BDJ]